jgi:hypothetical protein
LLPISIAASLPPLMHHCSMLLHRCLSDFLAVGGAEVVASV